MTFQIMTWEIMRNLRNKQFLIGVFLSPLLMVLLAGLPFLASKLDSPQRQLYFVIDQAGLMDSLTTLARGTTVDFVHYEGAQDDVVRVVREQKATGYLILDEAAVEAGEVHVYLVEMSPKKLSTLESVLTNTIQQRRLADSGLSREYVDYLTSPVNLVPASLDPNAKYESPLNGIIVSGSLAAFLLMVLLSSGSMLLQSALQEKRDRMAEVVLSSVTPNQLMQGKILGHFVLGLIQIAVWLGFAIPVARFYFDIPVFEILGASNLPALVLFAVLGYLLYAALFVGIGATMEDIQSAGNAQGMVFLFPMLPFFLAGPVISNPNGIAAKIGTFFPLTSPAIVVLRLGLVAIPITELLLSAALLLLTTWGIIRLSAKVFRIGMLMYGKTATPREIMKWIRYKE